MDPDDGRLIWENEDDIFDVPPSSPTAPQRENKDIPLIRQVQELTKMLHSMQCQIQQLTQTEPKVQIEDSPVNHTESMNVCSVTSCQSSDLNVGSKDIPRHTARNFPNIANIIPEKFSGQGGDNPITFLRGLEMFISVYQPPVSDTKVLLMGLLTHNAARWLRSKMPSLASNDEIVNEFRAEFISEQYVQAIWRKIHGSVQNSKETAVHYIDRMCSLYDSLPDDEDEGNIIRQIITNALPQVSLHLGSSQYKSIGGLKAEAARVDSCLSSVQQNHPYFATATSTNNYNRKDSGYDDRQCYKCGARGHIRKNCPSTHNHSKNGNERGGRPVPGAEGRKF